jgi:uncharacterized protein YggE
MKLVASLVLVTALGVFGQTAQRSTVQSTGNASVSVTPDQAQINVSAITQATTAQDAANQNATIATNIQSQLAQALGSSGTVKTVSYSVTPNYTYKSDGTSVLNGYTVTNTIQVTLNDLTITGKVIDTATQAGASRIDSLQFTLKDDTDARSQALKAATLKAKVHPLTAVAAPGAATTPVQPGQLSVTGNVTISVELLQ